VAKCAESDPKDWEIWQANHEHWTNLVSAELEYRAGKTVGWYRELLDEIRDKDGLLTSYRLATPGSSSSNLSNMQAFERGYTGGWAR
jgi:hypothetical protein